MFKHSMFTAEVRGYLLMPLILIALLFSGCNPIADLPATTSDEPASLVVATHDSFNLSTTVIDSFEAESGIDVQFLELGDAGAALNRLILSKDAPLADVFFGTDNTFSSRALDAEIFAPYQAPALAQIPDEFELDEANRLIPVDYGFVNINADRLWFEEQGLALPETLEDLADPIYSGLLVVENPATSSPGLAFLLTTIAYFGESDYLDFWQSLRENDVLVTSGWSEAYYTHFTVGSGGSGDRPLVVSYSTSPPADVLFAEDGRTEPASVNINFPNGTFRQIEYVGIIDGTENREAAEQFVDFLLSRPVQEDIPLQMFVYPVLPEAELPDLFVRFAEQPTDPAMVDPESIEANRESWIDAWTEVMLR